MGAGTGLSLTLVGYPVAEAVLGVRGVQVLAALELLNSVMGGWCSCRIFYQDLNWVTNIYVVSRCKEVGRRVQADSPALLCGSLGGHPVMFGKDCL